MSGRSKSRYFPLLRSWLVDNLSHPQQQAHHGVSARVGRGEGPHGGDGGEETKQNWSHGENLKITVRAFDQEVHTLSKANLNNKKENQSASSTNLLFGFVDNFFHKELNWTNAGIYRW